MIAWLQGTLLEKRLPTLVLNVNGVGYEVEVPMSALARRCHSAMQSTRHRQKDRPASSG